MLKFFLHLICIVIMLQYCNGDNIKKTVIIPPELVTKIIGAVQKCQAETGIDADILFLILDRKYREDEEFKNLIYCTYNTLGYVHKDGHINAEKAVEYFKREPLVEEGIRRCSRENGNNPRDILFHFFKCFLDTTPVRFTI